jgi:Flp pilus assembly protein TadG
VTTALRRLARDVSGVSVVEFGFVAPLLIVMLLGSLQLSFDVWAKSILNGAVQEAGRDSGLEDAQGDQSSIDTFVGEQVHAFLPSAKMTYKRKNYETFSDVGRPEDYTDANDNGVYDNNECFEDENANGQWDADVGASGQGGARDVVVYTAMMEYTELVPLSRFIGLDGKRTLSATTTLMNQPFSTQADRVVKVVCP